MDSSCQGKWYITEKTGSMACPVSITYKITPSGSLSSSQPGGPPCWASPLAFGLIGRDPRGRLVIRKQNPQLSLSESPFVSADKSWERKMSECQCKHYSPMCNCGTSCFCVHSSPIVNGEWRIQRRRVQFDCIWRTVILALNRWSVTFWNWIEFSFFSYHFSGSVEYSGGIITTASGR